MNMAQWDVHIISLIKGNRCLIKGQQTRHDIVPQRSIRLVVATLGTHINAVTLRPALLVLGWVTARQYTVLVRISATQANSALYPQRDGKISTGQRAVTHALWLGSKRGYE